MLSDSELDQIRTVVREEINPFAKRYTIPHEEIRPNRCPECGSSGIMWGYGFMINGKCTTVFPSCIDCKWVSKKEYERGRNE